MTKFMKPTNNQFFLLMMAFWLLVFACLASLELCKVDDCDPQEVASVEPEIVVCGCDSKTETSYDQIPEEVSTKRRTVRIWIAPGSVRNVSEADYRAAILQGLKEISDVTRCDFVLHHQRSGSQLRFSAASNDDMWKWFPRWRPKGDFKGILPLAAQKGNEIRYLRDTNRWSTVRLVVAATIHETGHWARLRYPSPDPIHSKDMSDIMHAHLPVLQKSSNDTAQFQKRLGVK